MPLLGIRGSASATGFGYSLSAGKNLAGARGVTAGGQQGGTGYNQINYFTIATAGNATDFGDLTNARTPSGAVGNLTRAVFGAGAVGYTVTNVLDYITIASTGNATDFGDALVSTYGLGGSCCNEIRGIFAGGYVTGSRGVNIIQYVTIASTGNATDFGDLTVGRYQVATAISSPTRGVFAGGNS